LASLNYISLFKWVPLCCFEQKNWASTVVDNGVKFNYVSADGEAGFPGEVWFETIYQLDGAENTLRIETKAITDKETPVNVTNHTYFNLAGEDTPEKIYDQEVKLCCDKYLDFNRDDVTVTGKINPVEGGKYDFRKFQKLAQRIKADGHWPDEGYDNFFLLTDDKSELRDVASVRNVANGLRLDVKSNQNGVQFYTGNHLNVKRNDRPTGGYSIHHGFCLEAHNYPDSVNQVLRKNF
jgi:aldose 1-epimerase